MLKVINVGQGDAFLFTPSGCMYEDELLLIDTGVSQANVASLLSPGEYSVMITHSHHDHMGGLPALMRAGMVKNLIIPYYLPEVTRIAKYLDRHVRSRITTPDWRRLRKLPIQFVCEGRELCGHATVLNPPGEVREVDFTLPADSLEQDIRGALETLSELGLDLPIDDIVNYTPPVSPDDDPGYPEKAQSFVHTFFIGLALDLRRHQVRDHAYYLAKHLELTANQASIVFRHRGHQYNWLFTGDADERVFNRLIDKGVDISAHILKVPHHGSRENLSRPILKKISPYYAVVSHGNRKFGRSKDTHPHHEVIDLLDEMNIQTFYTNAVIKDGDLIKNQTSGVALKAFIEFI